MNKSVKKNLIRKKNQIAILFDPDKIVDLNKLQRELKQCEKAKIDYIFVGGSTCDNEKFSSVIHYIKNQTLLPIIIFPGSPNQVSEDADSILFLSLISGRNPYYLIDSQIEAAEKLKQINVNVQSTSYILIDGGKETAVQKVSKTNPIARDNHDVIYKTALAGYYLGHTAIYLDAGSGALQSVSYQTINLISTIESIIIVGGGIRKIEQIKQFHESGAHITVIGNYFEENPEFLIEIERYRSNL